MRSLLTKKQEELNLPESLIVTVIITACSVLTIFGTMCGWAAIRGLIDKIGNKKKDGEEVETK